MLIDWFTVCAQALNFLILVWLMKRYLYKPILNAIDTREKLVAKELADANTKMTEAQKEHAEFQKKNDAFDKHHAALLSKTADEAKAVRTRLLDEAHQAADELSAKRQQALLSDARQLNQAVSRRAQQEVFAIARKTLTDLASAGLEEQMSEVFIRRLREMDAKAKDRLNQGLRSSSEPAVVRSTFELPAKQRTAVRAALHETLPPKTEIKFMTSPELVGGIEVLVNGQKLAWSIADYLESLESGVGELLSEQAKPEAKEKPKRKTRSTHTVKVKPKPGKAKLTTSSR